MPRPKDQPPLARGQFVDGIKCLVKHAVSYTLFRMTDQTPSRRDAVDRALLVGTCWLLFMVILIPGAAKLRNHLMEKPAHGFIAAYSAVDGRMNVAVDGNKVTISVPHGDKWQDLDIYVFKTPDAVPENLTFKNTDNQASKAPLVAEITLPEGMTLDRSQRSPEGYEFNGDNTSDMSDDLLQMPSKRKHLFLFRRGYYYDLKAPSAPHLQPRPVGWIVPDPSHPDPSHSVTK
jgi:hypothetical protein